MSEPEHARIEEPDFQAVVEEGQARAWAVRLSGTADLHVKRRLATFLDSVHQDALGSRVDEVCCDLRNLAFMNSSCLKGFIDWITALQDQPGDRRYRIVFRSNPDLDWQRRSLQVLARIAGDVVTVHLP